MPDSAEPTSLRFVAEVPKIVPGLLLIAAALLKFYAPYEAATLQVAYELPKWLIITATQLELALGVALLTGVFPGPTRRLAIVVFICFAGFSLYRLLGGHESCGCFGALLVPPWLTLLVDLVFAAGLHWQRGDSVPVCSPRWALAVYGIVATPLLASAALEWLATKDKATQQVASTESLIILEPETWLGKPFPLWEFLNPMNDLLHDEWVLLFYHHTCPDCQVALPRYEQLATTDPSRKVLLIEVPPYGPIRPVSFARQARLSNQKEWFVQTPVEVTLNGGNVVRVTHDLE